MIKLGVELRIGRGISEDLTERLKRPTGSIKHLLGTYYVSGTMVGAENTKRN